MSDISNYKISLGDQLFFINSNPVAGVQSIQYNMATNVSNLQYLGQKKYNSYANGIQGGSVNIDQVVISDDIFYPMTGASGCNGYVILNVNDTSKNYSFASGYMSSYSVRGSIGSPIQISVGFDIFGPIGTLSNSDHAQISNDFTNISSHSYVDPDMKFAHPQYTSITTNKISDNRLQDFQINLTIPRSPTFYLGNTEPSHVERNGPITVDCSFQYEIDNYTMMKSKTNSVNRSFDDISIALKTKSGSTIQTYTFNDIELISEDFSSANNGNASVSSKYQKLIKV